jgi:hypothetical protein
MVAVLIDAGLPREELLWLTVDDVDLARRHGGNGLIRVQAKTVPPFSFPNPSLVTVKLSRYVQ